MALRARMSGGNSMWRTGNQLQGIPSCSAAEPGEFCLQSGFTVPPRTDGGKVFLKHCRRTELLLLTRGWFAQGGLASGFLTSLPCSANTQRAERCWSVSQPSRAPSQGPAELLMRGRGCQQLPNTVTAESSSEANQMVVLFQPQMKSTYNEQRRAPETGDADDELI